MSPDNHSSSKEDLPLWFTLGFLGILTLLGAWLRLSTLGEKSLWMDECWQGFFLYTFRLDELLHITMVRQWEPPFIYLISYLFTHLFGFSEAVLRLPSCLAGIATIPMGYLLGRQIGNRRLSLLVAFLFAIHPTVFWYSQEARPYALLIFSVTAVLWLFLRPTRKDKASIAYMIALVLMANTHYFAAIPGAMLCVIDLYRKIRRNDKRPFWMLVVEYLPWITLTAVFVYYRITGFNLVKETGESIAPIMDIRNWEMVFSNLAFGYRRVQVLAWGLVAVGLWVGFKRRAEVSWFFILCATIGTAVIMILSIILFRYRYFYFLLPPFILLMALSLEWLISLAEKVLSGNKTIWRISLPIIVIAGMLFWVAEPLCTRINGEKMDYRIMAYLCREVPQDSGIILIPDGDLTMMTSPPYYHGALHAQYIPKSENDRITDIVQRNVETVPQGIAVFPDVCSIAYFQDRIKNSPTLYYTRLYAYGFHVLYWNQRAKSEVKMIRQIWNLFGSAYPLNYFMSLAYYYEDRCDWENAEKNARKALEINPDCLANSLLGRVLREQHRDDEAKIFEKRAWMIYVLLCNNPYAD